MTFIRTRTIKGRNYLYREERWREGGKVRSKSTYIGPGGSVGGLVVDMPITDCGRGQYGYAPFAAEETIGKSAVPAASPTPAAPAPDGPATSASEPGPSGQSPDAAPTSDAEGSAS